MKYKGIIADPPWLYDSKTALVGNGGRGFGGGEVRQVNTDNHYPTMTLEAIKNLDVPAADSAMLFMWTTNPFLASGEAASVVRAWGFEPVTVLTWAKVQADGMTPSRKNGWWFRSASEHVIVGKRGKIARPPGYPALPTWFPHGRLAHSVKPTILHDWMQEAVPEGPWLEMFARRRHPGWDLWGNEAPSLLESALDDLIRVLQ